MKIKALGIFIALLGFAIALADGTGGGGEGTSWWPYCNAVSNTSTPLCTGCKDSQSCVQETWTSYSCDTAYLPNSCNGQNPSGTITYTDVKSTCAPNKNGNCSCPNDGSGGTTTRTSTGFTCTP